MTKGFQFQVLTHKRAVYTGTVTSVVAPGSQGRFGVLVRHAPMISSLETGILKIRGPEGREVLAFVGTGFLMVEKDHVVILASQAELAHEIDTGRAKASLTRAKERLRDRSPDLDVTRAEASLTRAVMRLKVSGVS